MINNPFILVGDIPAPYFCDRQQEVARLIKAFHGGENLSHFNRLFRDSKGCTPSEFRERF